MQSASRHSLYACNGNFDGVYIDGDGSYIYVPVQYNRAYAAASGAQSSGVDKIGSQLYVICPPVDRDWESTSAVSLGPA
jgi:hypothetical protein